MKIDGLDGTENMNDNGVVVIRKLPANKVVIWSVKDGVNEIIVPGFKINGFPMINNRNEVVCSGILIEDNCPGLFYWRNGSYELINYKNSFIRNFMFTDKGRIICDIPGQEPFIWTPSEKVMVFDKSLLEENWFIGLECSNNNGQFVFETESPNGKEIYYFCDEVRQH